MKIILFRISNMLGLTALMIIAIANASAQQYYYYYDEEPTDGITPLEKRHVVAPSGKITLNAFDYYTYGLESHPDHFRTIPMDFSRVNFSLRYTYETPAGDNYPESIQWPMSGLGIFSQTFSKGYYRNWSWAFGWEISDGISDSRTLSSGVNLIVPNVIKIPVYVYTEALNKSASLGNQPILEMMELRKTFRDLETTLSMLATNIRNNYGYNHGCSGWYQFRFMGYVDGFGQGIDSTDDLKKVPPGITIVPNIDICGYHQSDNIGGCALVNGNQIVVAEQVLSTSGLTREVVILHEIGHSKGLEHYLESEDFVMSARAHSGAVGIAKEDCPEFSKSKTYNTPELWGKKP